MLLTDLKQNMQKLEGGEVNSLWDYMFGCYMHAFWLVLTYDLLEERCIDDITIKHILLLYHTKQIDSILSWVCAVMDQRRRKDIVRNNINNKVRNNYSKEPRIVTDMLNKLEWPSLEWRWIPSWLSMFNCIVYHTVDIDKDSYLTPLLHTSRSSNSKTFIRPHSNCNQYAYSFFLWSVNQWNRLAGDIVNIDENLKFKATLRSHLIETGNWF